ncbi:MAG: glycosyltransferase, partial [Candidatus Zixiibacteriota bacterium]
CDEGFGMVYVEAIMCGCPVICRKNDGGEEIIEKTNGGLAVDIPESDEAAVVNIRQAVENIIENKDRFMSAEIIEKARQLVAPTVIKNKWETLLKKYYDKLN